MEQLQITAKCREGISPVASHFHDCHQLIYVVRGSAEFVIGARHYRATPGTLLVISRLEAHGVYDQSPDYCRYTVQITGALSEKEDPEGLMGLLVNRPGDFSHGMAVEGCQALLEMLARECEVPGPMSGYLRRLLLQQLLLHICRSHPELMEAPSENWKLIRSIQQDFEADPAKKWTLRDLAQQHHLSESYLSHLFKKITGRSVMGYLQSTRIAEAKRLLTHTEADIGTVVERCGFSDCSNFSRTFKSLTGMTPSQFRLRFTK